MSRSSSPAPLARKPRRQTLSLQSMEDRLTPVFMPTLYAVDSNLGQLFSVDPTTGATTLIGSTAFNGLGTPAGLDYDGTTMFAIDLSGGELFSINLTTAEPTLIGSSGIPGWQSLASNTSGQMFGVNQDDDNLYSIDKTTGAATLIGFTGGGLLSAIEFDAAGTLWAIDFFSGAIGTLNTTTGAFTSSVSTALSGFQGLTFDAAGNAYGSNTNTDSLYTINLTTGTATLVGAMPGTQFVKGLEFNVLPAVATPAQVTSVLATFGTNNLTHELVGGRTTLPWAVKSLELTFNQPVTLTDVQAAVTGLPSGAITMLTPSSFLYTPVDPISSGTVNLAVAGAGFTSFSLSFTVRIGDVSGDGKITSADLARIQQLRQTGGYDIFADLDGNGVINQLDYNIARSRMGT